MAKYIIDIPDSITKATVEYLKFAGLSCNQYTEPDKNVDEIHVGDEVKHKKLPELKIYVTDMDDNSFGGFALCRVENVCDYGDRFSECNVHEYKPTGRVLPNIVELLKKISEVQHNEEE